MHTYTYTYTHMRIHTYVHTYIHTYIHTCTHTCTHTGGNWGILPWAPRRSIYTLIEQSNNLLKQSSHHGEGPTFISCPGLKFSRRHCTHTRIHTYVHTYMHTHAHAHTHAYIHAHTESTEHAQSYIQLLMETLHSHLVAWCGVAHRDVVVSSEPAQFSSS